MGRVMIDNQHKILNVVQGIAETVGVISTGVASIQYSEHQRSLGLAERVERIEQRLEDLIGD